MEQDPLLGLSAQSLAGLMQRQKMQQAAAQNQRAAQPGYNPFQPQDSSPVAGLWDGSAVG